MEWRYYNIPACQEIIEERHSSSRSAQSFSRKVLAITMIIGGIKF